MSNTQNGQGYLGQMGTSFFLSNGYSNGFVFQRATTGSSPNNPDGSGLFNFANDVKSICCR